MGRGVRAVAADASVWRRFQRSPHGEIIIKVEVIVEVDINEAPVGVAVGEVFTKVRFNKAIVGVGFKELVVAVAVVFVSIVLVLVAAASPLGDGLGDIVACCGHDRISDVMRDLRKKGMHICRNKLG